jgi:hypothetical protein
MKTSLARITTLCFLLCGLGAIAGGQGLPVASPQSVGMNGAKLEQIEPLVLADIADKKLPGASSSSDIRARSFIEKHSVIDRLFRRSRR